MNILISSASAKRPLLEGFRSALSILGVNGKLIAADSDDTAPAAAYADVFVQQPRDGAPDYAERWLELCAVCHVDLLVPTRDAELQALSLLKPQLAARGVTVPVAPPEAIAICLDKLRFHEFCIACQFPVLPRLTGPFVATDLPLFARLHRGAGARTAFAVTRAVELDNLSAEMLVQPYCDLPEFSIDCLFSIDGEPLQAVVRERIEIVAGESVVTAVRNIPELSDFALRVGQALRLAGHVVFQCFYSEASGPLLIECNPRFGGASMVSVAAGLASCERILLEVMGECERAHLPREIRCDEIVDRRQLPPGVVL